MAEAVTLGLPEAYDLALEVLRSNGLSAPHAASVARVIHRGQVDECQSHGLHRLILCVRTLRAGRVSPDALPDVSHPTAAIVRVDARGAYSPLSFDVGRPLLVEKARTNGIAALAINRCCHFSALWPEVEDLAADGVAALCMLPSYSCVAPAGGTRPVLGTNPIAFAWPRPGSAPYVFDFATSAVARGEIELHRGAGKDLEPGWALDASGRPTTDPAAALAGAMLTFGGHKGSALSTMVELLAGPLIGDLTSMEATTLETVPCHGELIVAFDPAIFGGPDSSRHAARAEALFDAIVGQGARLPSQRRYEARARSAARGTVSIPRQLHDDILALRR